MASPYLHGYALVKVRKAECNESIATNWEVHMKVSLTVAAVITGLAVLWTTSDDSVSPPWSQGGAAASQIMELPIAGRMVAAVAESGRDGERLPGVTRVEIRSVESPTFDGRSFGTVGQYEKIFAVLYGELDPEDPRNAVITDIDLAPRNTNGLVEYQADLHIIKPVDLFKGNQRMFYSLNNRGNKGLGTFNGAGGNNPTTAEDAGTAFLMERGYTMVWSGWEDESIRPPGDHRVLASLPTARAPDGSSIVGMTIYDHVFDTDAAEYVSMVEPGVRDGLKYLPADNAEERTRILVRNNSRFVGGPLVERRELPGDVWHYTDDRTIRIDRRHPFLASYDAGAAFEIIYPAMDPLVLGVGFAAVRDAVAFLRHDASDANPLRGGIQYAISQGQSQSGRFLRDFIYWGFNEDLEGRKVFEGIMPRVAGVHRTSLDERFGDPDATSRSYHRELNSKMEFPFTYEVRYDSITGLTDGIFIRCLESDTCPKVMQIDHGNEGWLKALNLLTTDGLGREVPLPENVRLYYIASAPHGTGPGVPAGHAICAELTNPIYSAPYVRALVVALDDWATRGIEPPESRYPRTDDGTLAPSLPQAGMGFPSIPGVTYTGWYIPVAAKDKTSLPNHWIEGKEYVVLVPTTDEDGNDLAGIRPVEVQVPVGTYTGWATRRAPFAEGEDCGNQGQFIPFRATRQERERTGDPRLSIEERYESFQAYRTQVAQAVAALAADGFVLDEDMDALNALADAGWVRFRFSGMDR